MTENISPTSEHQPTTIKNSETHDPETHTKIENINLSTQNSNTPSTTNDHIGESLINTNDLQSNPL